MTKCQLTFFKTNSENDIDIPMATERVQAGFPSPAANYLDDSINLNKYLIKNPPATFLVRVEGESMINAGIKPGDIMIVDRSMEAKNNDIVIAVVNGEFTIKRLLISKGKITLQPENCSYKPIDITGDMDFEVWGKVVTGIHSF